MPAVIIIANFKSEAEKLIQELLIEIIDSENSPAKTSLTTLMFDSENYDKAVESINKLLTANYPLLPQQQFLLAKDTKLKKISSEIQEKFAEIKECQGSIQRHEKLVKKVDKEEYPSLATGYAKTLHEKKLLRKKLQSDFKLRMTTYKERLDFYRVELLKYIKTYSASLFHCQSIIDIRPAVDNKFATLSLPHSLAGRPLSAEDFQIINSATIQDSMYRDQIIKALCKKDLSLLNYLRHYQSESGPHVLIKLAHNEILKQKHNELKGISTKLFAYYKCLHADIKKTTPAVIAATTCVFKEKPRIAAFFKPASSQQTVPILRDELNDEDLIVNASLYFINKIQNLSKLSHSQIDELAELQLKTTLKEQVLAEKLLALISEKEESSAVQERTHSR